MNSLLVIPLKFNLLYVSQKNLGPGFARNNGVKNSKGELIYISRALVPGAKKTDQKIQYYKQVCIYAFNKRQLKKFYSKRKKSETESIEDIEILRFFDLNEKIKMIKLNSNSIAVDEIADVKKAEKLLIKKNRT